MKNNTDCLIVLRSYNIPYVDKKGVVVRMKEIFFRDSVNCRRYCIAFDKIKPYIYDITEHNKIFFDQIADAFGGRYLYNIYCNEGINPVPIKNSSEIYNYDNYNNLTEFCVIYNIVYNEQSLVNTIQKGKYPMNYNDSCMIIDGIRTYKIQYDDTDDDDDDDDDDNY